METKKVIRHSANVVAPIIIGGAVLAMIADSISQISAGATSDLPMNILGWLILIGFVAFVRHATLLHVDSLD